MGATLRTIVKHIQEIVQDRVKSERGYCFLSQLGNDLGPARLELEKLAGIKLRQFLEQELGVSIRPVSDMNKALAIREDALAGIDDFLARSPEKTEPDQAACDQSAPSIDVPSGTQVDPMGQGPRFIKSVWSAFLIPLQEGKARYLIDGSFMFVDVAEDDSPPEGGLTVRRDLIASPEEPEKQNFVFSSIKTWASESGIDIVRLQFFKKRPKIQNADSDDNAASSGTHSEPDHEVRSSKGDPIYPSISSTMIEPILEDAARYKTKAEALRLIHLIRNTFTCKKLESDEVRSEHDFIFIRGYDVTAAQRDRGEVGAYARIYIQKVGQRWHVRAESARDRGWKSPFSQTNWREKDHPNWSLKTLRRLRKGPVFYDNEDNAKDEMSWLVDSFPGVIKLSDNKIACMIYQRNKDSKKIEFEKVQIRLAYDQSDRPFLYMDWRFAEKNKQVPMIQVRQDHPASTVDGLVRSMFETKTDVDETVSRITARELLNWEGRGKLKATISSDDHILYHYTSMVSLDAILTNGQMWLTDMRYMNDFSEIIHGHAVLTSFFETYSHALEELEGGSPQWRADVLSRIDEILAINPTSELIYGLCLSDDVEQAAQWLTYANRGNGVAMGLDRDALTQALAKADLGLRRVYYHADRKANILHNVLKAVFAEPRLQATDIEELAKSIAKTMRSLVPIFKHHSFYTEKEWRLIKRGQGDPDIWAEKTRPKGDSNLGLSAPYVTLDLGKHLGVTVAEILRRVVIGPGERKEERKRSVEAILRRTNLRDVDVTVSDIPLSGF